MSEREEHLDDARRDTAEGDLSAHDTAIAAEVSEHVDDAETDKPESEAVDLATDVTATDREAAANEAAERRRTIDPRAARRWSLRALAGASSIALVAGGLWAASEVDATNNAQALTETIVPDAAAQYRVCAGPAVSLGSADGANAAQLNVLAEPSVSVAAASGEPSELPISFPDSAGGGDIPTWQLRGESTNLAAAQTLRVETERVAGFAASECREPGNEQWLVGGSTTTGRSALLVIANAGAQTASVTVTVYGESGPVTSVGNTGIVVGSGQAKVVDLAGLAPGLQSPVVQVRSTGAPVATHIATTVTRGLTAGGIDTVDAASAPSVDAVIAGLRVELSEGVETQDGYADAAPALRLFSNESTTVVVETQLEGREPESSEVELVGGQVTEFGLGQLATGTYSIRVRSSVPIVVGARATLLNGTEYDWLSDAPTLSESITLTVPRGPGARLHLMNTTDEVQEVLLDGGVITIRPGAISSSPISAGEHTLQGTGIAAAVTYKDDTGIGGFSITPQGPAADGVEVSY